MKNIVIIGGGVAGLSAGIYAKLNGYNATIYEKHFKEGGNLTGWDREGYHIDNCIHWLTGTNKNSKLYSMWEDLGVLNEEIKIHQADTLYTFIKDNKSISLHKDIEKTKEEMLSISIIDKKEIESFIKAIKLLQGIEGIKGKNNDEKSNLVEIIKGTPLLLKYYNLSTDELKNRFKSPILQGFIVSLLSEHFSSLALLSVFATFSGKNGGIPEGGSTKMAKRMLERYKSLGGKIYFNKAVKKINIQENKALSLTLEDENIVNADYIIATIDPSITFSNLLEEKYMPKLLKKQYEDKNRLKFSSYHCVYVCDESQLPFKGDAIFEIPNQYREFLHSKYLIVREFSFEKTYSKEGKNILQTMIFCDENDCKKFIKLSENKEEYLKRKKEISKIIQEILIDQFPNFKDKLKCIDVYTPATYKRYTNSKLGTYMAFTLPKKTIPLKITNEIKGIDNVFLATQWLQSPGGLPIAASKGKEVIMKIKKTQNNS